MRTVLDAAAQAVREARIALQGAEQDAETARDRSIKAEKRRVLAQRAMDKAEADYRKVKEDLE